MVLAGLGGHNVIRTAVAVGTVPNTMGPGTGTILIHEFSDETQEALAFETGQLDLMDRQPAKQFYDAWIGSGFRNIVTSGRAGLQRFTSLEIFQIDINNWNFPTNDKSLRQALGYLLDRRPIVLNFAGEFAVPDCANIATGAPGSRDCLRLGYPNSFGDFNPTKALQVLYEAGWRDNNGNGVLESPTGTEPTLIFYIRLDDLVLRQAGEQLTNALENLPGSFTAKPGGSVTVCPTANCKINIDAREVDRSTATRIVLRGPDWKDWHLYTGGWSQGLDPDHLFGLYGSQNAPRHCGGGWPIDIAVLNYVCYVDQTYDTLAKPLSTGRTYADVIAAAQAVQDYAWGYDSLAGRIKGTMPVLPLYSGYLSVSPYSNRDQGSSPILNSDGSSACWKGWIGQEVGGGLAELAENIEGASLYNCQTKPTYVSYRGQGIMDWGFRTIIQDLNPVTSQWPETLAMQQTYESCLKRNPVKLAEIITSGLCESFGETTYFNTALGREGTVAVYKFRNGVLWSDGRYMTALDFKFSFEYAKANFGSNLPGSEHILRVDVNDADPVNGIGGTAHVYFDDIGALFMQHAGFLPVIAQHVWCPSWPDTTSNCPYASAYSFPDFDFSKHIGTGPYLIAECTGIGCSETVTLKPNPFYKDGTRWWNVAAGVSLQPDVNRDDQVNQADLDLLNKVDPNDSRFDVDFRMTGKTSETFTNPLGGGFVTVSLRGPRIENTDQYILQRLLFEGQQLGYMGGITWPPRANVRDPSMTYNWPDVNKNNDVDLDDLISVYLHQFQNPKAVVSKLAMNDVDYDTDVDLDDLVIVLTREFTKPAGVPFSGLRS